jgi:colicin import membrane protein
MSAAITSPAFALDHRNGLLVSVGAHLLLVVLFSSNVIMVPKPRQQLMAIEAVIVTEAAPKRDAAADQRAKELAAQRARAEQARQAEAAKQQRAADTKREQQQLQSNTERKQVEQKRAETKRAEAALLATQQKQRDAETKQAAERARVEREQEQARQKAVAERKQREAKARAEADRQRAIAAAERGNQERREAEMLASMAAEESLLAARQSGEMSRYIALIQQKVERNWVRPASAQAGLECEVAVQQLPNGDVMSVKTVRCNGDDAVRRSIENAVRRAAPLPLPDNRVLFDRNLSFTFRPDS